MGAGLSFLICLNNNVYISDSLVRRVNALNAALLRWTGGDICDCCCEEGTMLADVRKFLLFWLLLVAYSTGWCCLMAVVGLGPDCLCCGCG